MFFANCFDLEQRDRALITSPVWLRMSTVRCHSRTAYSKLVSSLVVVFSYHRSLPHLMFSGHCGRLRSRGPPRKWKTGLLALLSFPVHPFENVQGSLGPDGCQGPIFLSGAVLFVAATCVARTLGPERLAESRDRDSALAGHISGGHGGEDPRRSRQFPGYSATAALSGEDSGLKRFSCGAYPRSFRNFED